MGGLVYSAAMTTPTRRMVLETGIGLAALSTAHAGAHSRVDAGRHGHHTELKIRYPLDYLVYEPEGYSARGSQRWPLMLFLHGSGERGSDLDAVKRHGPPKRIEEGRKFPCIVVAPQCPDNSWWDAIALEALLQEITAHYRVDPARICLTGLSMGGFGTWDLAARNPQRYAAIVPVCGRGEPLFATQLAKLPIWAFHGAKDSVVPLRYSQDVIDAIRAIGGNARLTIYPEADHDSWTDTYANDAVYEWMLAQRATGA